MLHMGNADQKERYFDKSLFKDILSFAWPIMLANLLQISFNFADTLVVGNFVSEKGLAAVGSAAPLIVFFTWGLNGLSLGADVLISRMIGGKEYKTIEKAVCSAIFIALIFGTLIGLFGFLFSRQLLAILATPADILSDASLYTRVYFLSCLPIAIYHFGSSILRATGNTKDPTLFLAVSGAANVALNYLSVALLKMGILGAAFSSVIAQCISACLILLRLYRDKGLVRLRFRKELLDMRLAAKMLRYGIPSALQNQLFSFSNIIIQSSINSFGSLFVAANTAANAIEEYVYVFVDAFPLASLSFNSRLYGAKEYKKIAKVTCTTFLICGIGAFFIGAFILFNGRFFLGLLVKESKVIELGMYRLFYVTFFLFLNGLLDVIVNSIRGMGLVSLPTVVTLVCVCGFRLLYIYTVFALYHTPQVLYSCFPLSWTLAFVIQLCIWMLRYRELSKSVS
ncbi:MAG: MATE family efflux transporter [Erysipelotrichaceae bacterium]|nr:MATE family efflux transporter [Erysipelotrichaceae bacterium]